MGKKDGVTEKIIFFFESKEKDISIVDFSRVFSEIVIGKIRAYHIR